MCHCLLSLMPDLQKKNYFGPFSPAPSGPPRNLHAVTNSSSSIILYWRPPSIDQQNGEITSYIIRFRGTDPSYTQIITQNNSTLLITGLQAFTVYEFMVQARNNIGVGPLSPLVFSRTFEAGKRELSYCNFHAHSRIKLQIGLGTSAEVNDKSRQILTSHILRTNVNDFSIAV